MHHMSVGPLLVFLIALLLAMAISLVVYKTRLRGRLVVLALLALCALTDPRRDAHLGAVQKAYPGAAAGRLDAGAEYHDLLVLSAVSIQGRLVSVGWLGRVLVGSLSCGTLSAVSERAGKVRCS